ncbi:hypothetical protein [Fluviicola sp.]|jgi:hypothetical protein|uniref:hypothetical protein n=1 Tax=Fluviicola sp. TaxID=1917219 RepID=UPI0028287CAE|nr:hypothetical protein [Fluviicola sp.]MDR0802093.1 hypothetical protein [Fluviicola sp.]
MKTLVKLFGIAVLFFLTANCSSSEVILSESNTETVSPAPAVPQQVEEKTTSKSPVFEMQKIQKKRTSPADMIPTKQGE